MKRGAPDHWKMMDLAKRLKIPPMYAKSWAVGCLENLWHYAAKYAIQGDIGRVPNEVIATVCGWPAKSADRLVDALLASRWLDSCPTHRLLIHDWNEHADDSVRKTLKNRGLNFLFPENSSLARAQAFSSLPSQALVIANAEREPPPTSPKIVTPTPSLMPRKPAPSQVVRQAANGLTPDELTQAWDRHLKAKAGQPMNLVFSMILDRADFDVGRFRRNHPSYCQAAERDGWSFALSFWDWIEGGMLPGAPAKRGPESADERYRRMLDAVTDDEDESGRSAA